jgi:hypothetical protein
VNGSLRLGRSTALISLGMGIGIILGSMMTSMSPVTGAVPVDTLGFATCRIDQSLYRVQVTRQGTGSLVSGDANARTNKSRVSLVAVDHFGRSTQIQGTTGGGYVGVGFRATIPIDKGSLREVTVCFP